MWDCRCCGKGNCTPTWGCKLSKSRLFEQLEIQYSTVLDMPAYFQHPTRNAALSYFYAKLCRGLSYHIPISNIHFHVEAVKPLNRKSQLLGELVDRQRESAHCASCFCSCCAPTYRSRPSPRTTMSAVPSTSTPHSNFLSIFNAALESYKRKSKKDLASHPLLPTLQSSDSPEAILTVLREQIPAFKQSEDGDDGLTKWVVLYAFSATLGQGVGLVNIKRFLCEGFPI